MKSLIKKRWFIPVAVGTAIGFLNLLHYVTTGMIPGTETRFGLFPGGSIVLAPAWIAGKEISLQFKAIVILGIGIVTGSFILSFGLGHFWHIW